MGVILNFLTLNNILNVYPEKNEQHDIKPFDEFRKNVYSQCGEDGVLLEIFNRIKIFNKFYIEFGAWDGLILSNTANLRLNKKMGWYFI